jgi:hypothetical protein
MPLLISAFGGEKSIKYDKFDEKPRRGPDLLVSFPSPGASLHLKFGNFGKRFW